MVSTYRGQITYMRQYTSPPLVKKNSLWPARRQAIIWTHDGLLIRKIIWKYSPQHGMLFRPQCVDLVFVLLGN